MNRITKLPFLTSLTACLSLFCLSPLLAESQPAAKSTAVVGDISYLGATTQTASVDGGWVTIMENSIKTSEQKGLFVDVSLETGLLTRTLVRSKKGKSDTSTAEASVKVRVLCNGVPAFPAEVTFSSRSQYLSATFQGILEDENGDSCLLADLETGNVIIDEECLQPEEVELILETMSANSFNFIVGNLSSDVYLIEVQAKIDFGSTAEEGEAEARAMIGHGSVTVDEVRMIKDEDVIQ